MSVEEMRVGRSAQEVPLLRLDRPLVCGAVLVAMATMSACAGSSPSSPKSGVMVPVADVRTVAGGWAGVTSRTAGEQDDWLELTVNEDGTFEVFSAREVGALLGKGTLSVNEGKMTALGTHGSGVLTLYDRGGRVLVLDFRDRKGNTYSGELRPKK